MRFIPVQGWGGLREAEPGPMIGATVRIIAGRRRAGAKQTDNGLQTRVVLLEGENLDLLLEQ